MKFIITGAGGQLGKAFCSLLKKKGVEYAGMSHSDLDITDFTQVRGTLEIIQPDVIINCAAFTDVEKSEKDFYRAIMVNANGCKNLAVVASSIDSVLVTIGSDYVFDGEKGIPYTIADIPNPLSWYGRSKLLGEEFTKDFCSKFFIVRTSWLFGESESNFVKKFILWTRQQDVVKAPDNRFSSPSYTYDVAGAILDLVNTGNYGLYHVTNSGYCSRYKMAQYIKEHIGWQGKLVPVPEEDLHLKARRPVLSALDNFPLEKIVGYTLRSWEEAMDEYLKTIE